MRRLSVALILLAAVGCGGSSSPPASPSPSTASPIALTDFSGLWTGTYTFTTCTGERHCDLRIGTSQDFGLRLEQAGSRVHGLFTWSDFAAEISGDVRDDDVFHLHRFEDRDLLTATDRLPQAHIHAHDRSQDG